MLAGWEGMLMRGQVQVDFSVGKMPRRGKTEEMNEVVEEAGKQEGRWR